jgi:hypothetical protein
MVQEDFLVKVTRLPGVRPLLEQLTLADFDDDIKFLGSGQTSDVYKAVWNDKPVALKILKEVGCWRSSCHCLTPPLPATH